MEHRSAHDARLEALWGEVATPLRAFVARRVAVPADADDIVQEVFLRVHGGLDDLRDDERLTGWLYRIARNAVVDHYRAAPRRRELPVAEVADVALVASGVLGASGAAGHDADEPDPAATTRAELVACLRPALASLPPAAREALELTELGDLTQAEAAARLGLSVSGMKSRVQRARRQVRGLIEECCALVLDGRGAPIERRCRADCGAA